MRRAPFVVAVYVMVAAATFVFAGHRLLPLFDSIGPTPAYRWVHPPGLEAVGNRPPEAGRGTISLGQGGSSPASVSTGDGQFALSLGPDAIPRHDGDTEVAVSITPLDPARVPPLPAGWYADGNAYQVTLTYQPSGASVGALAGGNLVLQVPEPSGGVAEWDGHVWAAAVPLPAGSAAFVGSAAFTGNGVYLARSAGPDAPVHGGTSRVPTVTLAVAVAVLAVLLALGPRMVRR